MYSLVFTIKVHFKYVFLLHTSEFRKQTSQICLPLHRKNNFLQSTLTLKRRYFLFNGN